MRILLVLAKTPVAATSRVVSGLADDAHAIVQTVASLLTQAKLRPDAALMPLLIAISTNSLTRSLITFQSGGCTTSDRYLAVWLGDIAERAGFGF